VHIGRASAAVAAFGALAIAPARADRPPNIVLILCDDLGYCDIGVNGRTTWSTPNIDRLARQGALFRRWYCAAPVCCASRAALLTGKYGLHNGVSSNGAELAADEVTLPRALKARGYATAMFGKWHGGPPRAPRTSPLNPLDIGFDEFVGFTNAVAAWQKFPTELWFGRVRKPVSGFADTIFADHAIEYIRRPRHKPFFLYLAFTSPHFNVDAPREDIARFRGRFPERDPARPYNAVYAAMVTRLDAEVGRVLHALDVAGLARNTLVVFTSDQGASFELGNHGASAYHDSNRPFRGEKRDLWEGCLRVPGIVRWPGRVPSASVSNEVIHGIDLMPTLLAAAGGLPDPAWRVDGVNVLDVWCGLRRAPERTVFWEYRCEGYNQVAAMRGDLKLIITGFTPPELYDVVADPAERRNVIAQHPRTAWRLQRELGRWLMSETWASRQGRGATGRWAPPRVDERVPASSSPRAAPPGD
jgi:arylsulfatase A-like enzyme